MRGEAVLASWVLLGLCCSLLPREGHGVGGVLSVTQEMEERRMEDAGVEGQVMEAREEHLLEEAEIQRRIRRRAEETLAGRVRRAPEKEEGKGKKKKDKKDKKNKEPGATKKPKKEKGGRRGKDRDRVTTAPTTTLPPTTEPVIPTEAPTEPEPYPDYPFPDEDEYWAPDEEEPEPEVPDPYGDADYWGETEPTTSPPPVVDGKEEPYDRDFWNNKYKPESLPLPDGEEVNPTDSVDYAVITDDPEIPSFSEGDYVNPTDSDDYYSITDEPGSLPEGEDVHPTDSLDYYTITEMPSAQPPSYDLERSWYEDHDYDLTNRRQDNKEREKLEKEREDRERAERRREEEERAQRRREEEERAQRRREEEERARKRPRVFKEPKKCPPLGLESHKVEPDQILASSTSQYGYGPQRARLNMQGSSYEEDMRGGAWCANAEDKTHWIEIDARRVTEFTGVITQGRDSNNETDFVTSYNVGFSNDSREWTSIHDGYSDWLFFGNSDKDTPVINQFAEPVLARYIRVLPQSWNGSLCMRLEILGCPLPDPSVVHYRQNEVTPVDYLEFKHHNYTDMVKLMKSVHDECPNITSIYNLGQSSQGLDMLAMVISGNPTEHEIGEPEFRYTAGLHGNEAVGREMIILLMQYLCKEYKDGNPRVRRLVEGIRIHLVPSLNPDGQQKALAVGSELSGWTTGHLTEDGYDIFQNFPDLNKIMWEAEDKGMVPKLTPNHHVPIPADQAENTMAVETRHIITWMESIPFVLGANLQGGDRLVAYPYDNLRLAKTPETTAQNTAHRRRKRQYDEDEGFDGNEWGRGYQEEPEEDWRNRGYREETEEYWRGQGRGQEGYGHVQEGYERREEGYGGHNGYGHNGYGHEGYRQEGYGHEGYGHEGYGHEGYGHEGYRRREEEDDDRGRGGSYREAEPEFEPRATADDSLFRWLAISYASTHLTMTHTPHGSCHGDGAGGGLGITNRARWKPVKGSMNDFSYLHTNCLELSVFLGCDKFPHHSELNYEWEKNREAMLTFMEQVHRGIRGVVKDQEGNPISNATVSVEGVNHDVTTGVSGDYWRLLNPGEYRVTVRAEGYSPLTRLCVVGYDPGATTCAFTLAKSNWDRIKQIMALHGNKPIRLLSHGNAGSRRNTVVNGNRRPAHHHNGGGVAADPQRLRLRKLRLARLRRLRQERLMRAMTTLPPTTTTTVPPTTESTTSWYDSWFLGQTSAPDGFTNSILDYNYELKIDDY